MAFDEAFDEELTQLTEAVMDTFGEDAWDEACERANVVLRQAIPDFVAKRQFDGTAVINAALKRELRRLLQRH